VLYNNKCTTTQAAAPLRVYGTVVSINDMLDVCSMEWYVPLDVQ